ncbi:MAG TPA: diacylglycerol kinase family protein [Oscillospiraceae bacterium]|nr:diacylglycerol kinase family protein [Oscillospiraceae bacterium]
MRYVFIFNPAAGKKDPYPVYYPIIKNYCEEQDLPYTCLVTKYPLHAQELAKNEGAKGDEVRIYGVGGDGTLREIAAGTFGMENVEIGIIPCGSGDDYIRTFGKKEDFLSVPKQIHAKSRTVDMIRYNDGLALNLCSIGLDAAVAYNMTKFKKMPLITGSMAYDLALVKVFLHKIGNELYITIDGTKQYSGNYLFAVAANGKYYGGGYCAAPEALPDDGLLDFILIRTPKLRQVPAMVRLYKAGKHYNAKEFVGMLEHCRGKQMHVIAKAPAVGNFDGDCNYISDVCFEEIPQAARFIVPE